MVRLFTAGVVLACCALAAPAQTPPVSSHGSALTLVAALSEANIDLVGIPASELSIEVSGVAINQSGSAVVVAYSGPAATPGSRLLHVRVRDEDGRGGWRHVAIETGPIGAGTATQVRTAGTRTLVDTRIDDDTDTMIVLDPALNVERAVPGHLLALLDDDTVLVHENTAGFAPTRPAIVSVCALATGALERVHPLPPWSPPRKRFVERVSRAYSSWGTRKCIEAGHHCNAERFDGAIVSEVRVESHGRRVAWVERLGPAEGTANGPVDFRIHVLVACERGGSAPSRCVERAFAAYDGPDGEATSEALASASALLRLRATP